MISLVDYDDEKIFAFTDRYISGLVESEKLSV